MFEHGIIIIRNAVVVRSSHTVPKNNLNLHIKTDYISPCWSECNGVCPAFFFTYFWPKTPTYTVAAAPTATGSGFCAKIQITFKTVYLTKSQATCCTRSSAPTVTSSYPSRCWSQPGGSAHLSRNPGSKFVLRGTGKGVKGALHNIFLYIILQ